MTRRKRYSAEVKAGGALEAIREELTTGDLARKHGAHPTMISGFLQITIGNSISHIENTAYGMTDSG